MSKFILASACVVLIALILLSTVLPSSAGDWLYATDFTYNAIRILLIACLLGLLTTNPPRDRRLRAFVGLVSVGLMAWSLSASYNYQMQILDTYSILLTSIAIGLAGLELKTKDSLIALRTSSTR